VSVSDHLPRLNTSHNVFNVKEGTAESVCDTPMYYFKALESVKANEATGLDNILVWVFKKANVLAPQ